MALEQRKGAIIFRPEEVHTFLGHEISEKELKDLADEVNHTQFVKDAYALEWLKRRGQIAVLVTNVSKGGASSC